MKFKDLTNADIEYSRGVYNDKELSWDERMLILVKFFGKSERTVRKWCSERLGFKQKVLVEPEQYEAAKKKEVNGNKKRFLITWGQNNTKSHKKFLNNMKAYAEYIVGDIHIIAGRYQNPTSVANDVKNEFWSDDLLPYLDANRHNLHDDLSILSDVKIQPTAVNPMSGLVGMSGIDSCVFGSPKVHFEVVPALSGYIPKRMWTTGACTVKNYTDSKAGKKGEFHHTLGFVIIELDGDDFHVRQVTANDDGSFNDLFYEVKNGTVSKIDNIEAIILGDIHIGSTDMDVMEVTKGLMDRLKPKNTIIHDLFDGYAISHHHEKDPILKYHKEVDGTNSLKGEIEVMLEWLKEMRKYNLVIVRSNHDDFIDRWIGSGDWKKDIKNSVEYMDYAKVLLNREAPKGLIPYIIDNNFNDVKTLARDESFRVKEWELGMHGDVGANGSRGGINGFRRLNTKMVTAHSHSPARKDGALVVGTSTKLRLEYNKGASSWLHSHVLMHNSGKCQHINIINNKYTTL